MMPSLGGIARCLVVALFFLTPPARGGVQGWAITTMHLITLLAATLYFLDRIHRWEWRWIETPLDLPITVLLLLCGLAALFSENRFNSGWAFILCVNYVVLYYLMVHLFQTRSQVRLLIGAMIGSAFCVVMIGGLIWWGIHPFDWWYYEEIPLAANRIAASFGNPNHFAGYMALSLPVALAGGLLIFRSWVRMWSYSTALLIVVGLVLSLSRGGWIAGLCGSVFLVSWLLSAHWVDKKKMLFAVCGVMIVAFLVIFSNTTAVLRLVSSMQALGGRLLVWGATVSMIADNPLLGVGPGNFGTVFTQYHPPGAFVRFYFAENDYLQWIAEIGVGGIGIIGWMVAAIFIKALRKRNHPSRLVTGMTAGALSGLVAIGVHAIVDFPFHIPALVLMAVGLTALVTAPVPVKP